MIISRVEYSHNPEFLDTNSRQKLLDNMPTSSISIGGHFQVKHINVYGYHYKVAQYHTMLAIQPMINEIRTILMVKHFMSLIQY